MFIGLFKIITWAQKSSSHSKVFFLSLIYIMQVLGQVFHQHFWLSLKYFLGDGFDPLNHLTIYKPPPPYPGEHHSHFSSSTPDLASQTLPPLVGGSSPDLVSRRTLGPAAGRHNQVIFLMRLISCISGQHVFPGNMFGFFRRKF